MEAKTERSTHLASHKKTYLVVMHRTSDEHRRQECEQICLKERYQQFQQTKDSRSKHRNRRNSTPSWGTHHGRWNADANSQYPKQNQVARPHVHEKPNRQNHMFYE